ncbi:alpha/beta hydrolase [Amylibacter sp.]|nr:alpha/beta hydrolase [Amylibacter sp.]
MVLSKHISSIAERILTKEIFPLPDRSEKNILKIRSKAKTNAIPALKRILKSTNVTTKNITINEVSCLEVNPPKIEVPWNIIYGFGGGFVQGSPNEDLTIAAPLSAKIGAKVIIPDYRLAPENPWPAAVDDSFKVYQAICKKPFGIVGESAGGNIALALMLRAKKAGLPLPSASALLSPFCDLDVSNDSQTFNNGRDPSLTIQNSKAAVRLYAGNNDISNPDISPINGTYDSSFPPCLITTGTRDLLLSLSVRLASVLRDSGVDVDLQVWEGLWHVFEWYDQIPEADQSISNIAKFLEKHLGQ